MRALSEVALASSEANVDSLRRAHERVLASEQHLEQLIDALLALTRGQAGLERREHLDLAALTSEALLARESELAGLDLDVRATLDTAPTAGDQRLLERLIANLIDNAIRHNSTGGHLEITTGIRDRRAFVSIANTGPPSHPNRSSVSSNPSNAWTAPGPATTTATDWDSRSSRRSPTRTMPSSTRAPDPRAGSRSRSHSRRPPAPAPG